MSNDPEIKRPEAALTTRLKEIADFEIIGKLGQGGMGAVFKARQKSLDRIVALKVLAPKIAQDAKFIERFQREARASARLNHPNIVQGIDVGKDPATGLWYFAMEYVDGPSLKKDLEEQKVIPEERALAIVRDVAKALEAIGAHHMVHRDIKPDNILITTHGETKLADLGLAKQLDDDASLTQSGQAVGTPHYMSPEQVRGIFQECDIRTDIYSLGATLFHLVTGKPPFSGATSALIMSMHLSEPPPKAIKLNPAVSEGCSRMIEKMMQKKVELRVQTPADLIQQIDKILSGALSEAVTRGVQKTTGPRAPTTERRREGETAKGKSNLLYAGIAAVALGVVLLFALTRPNLNSDGGPSARATGKRGNAEEAEAALLAEEKRKSEDTRLKEESARLEAERRKLAEDKRKAEQEQAARLVTDAANKKTEDDGKADAATQTVKPPDMVAKPENGTTEVATANEPETTNQKPEITVDKAQQLFVPVLKELAPLLASNRFSDATALLDRKAKDQALAAAAELLKQERADIEAVVELRRAGVEALRKMAGQTVTLKKGARTIKGKVKDDPIREGITLDVGGPVLTVKAEEIDADDIDAHAPRAADAKEDLRRRGLLFLYAGNAQKARDHFTKAADGGTEAAVQPYLDRIGTTNEVVQPGNVGGKGVVASGGTIKDYAEKGVKYRAHIFTESGTLTVAKGGEIEYLVVAGGGGGGGDMYENGGGGAGGMLTGSVSISPQSYTVTVGAGGAGGHNNIGRQGAPSSIKDNKDAIIIQALGGGYGGTKRDGKIAGGDGGSGGGAGGYQESHPGGKGTDGQGHAGVRGKGDPRISGGGGGGAGGSPSASDDKRYAGGVGRTSSIEGSEKTYAQGGNGGSRRNPGAGTPGADNTGNGGNGAGNGKEVTADGGDGGSGIVVIRYVIK